MIPKWPYHRRVVDTELDELLGDLAAVTLEGGKAVGKTATATQRAATIYELDRDGVRELISADLDRVPELTAPRPSRRMATPACDLGRREACRRRGSKLRPVPADRIGVAGIPADPQWRRAHRQVEDASPQPGRTGRRHPTVSLARLLAGGRPVVDGSSGVASSVTSRKSLPPGFPVSDCSESGRGGRSSMGT